MIGILVGTDETQEWLLPWWWENYSKHNNHPVTFVDFGLSKQMQQWCKTRGGMISLRRPLLIKTQEEVESHLVADWEKHYPDTFWNSRESWFKKPLACAASPYEWTLWLDADCEVVAPLNPIWEKEPISTGLSLALDSQSKGAYPIYNSGVIFYQRAHPIIQEWQILSLVQNGAFRGDQDLLSHILFEKKFSPTELSPLYNWSVGEGENKEVAIYHWLGDRAKSLLQKKIIFENLL